VDVCGGVVPVSSFTTLVATSTTCSVSMATVSEAGVQSTSSCVDHIICPGDYISRGDQAYDDVVIGDVNALISNLNTQVSKHIKRLPLDIHTTNNDILVSEVSTTQHSTKPTTVRNNGMATHGNNRRHSSKRGVPQRSRYRCLASSRDLQMTMYTPESLTPTEFIIRSSDKPSPKHPATVAPPTKSPGVSSAGNIVCPSPGRYNKLTKNMRRTNHYSSWNIPAPRTQNKSVDQYIESLLRTGGSKQVMPPGGQKPHTVGAILHQEAAKGRKSLPAMAQYTNQFRLLHVTSGPPL
jgi:hypothetical protein